MLIEISGISNGLFRMLTVPFSAAFNANNQIGVDQDYGKVGRLFYEKGL